MQHPELSHPKFLLRYLSTLGLEPSTNQSVSTRWRPEGHNSESRLARRFEWTALGARPTRTKGKGGKDDKGKGGKDDKGKGGKGGWGGGKGGWGRWQGRLGRWQRRLVAGRLVAQEVIGIEPGAHRFTSSHRLRAKSTVL